MKRRIIQLIVFIYCFIGSSAIAEPIIVRFPESFPVSFNTSNGLKGMDVDVIKLILSRADVKYKIVSWPFKRSLHSMKTGKVHIMTNLTKNEKRSEYMHWIGPVRYTAIALIVLEKNKDLQIQNSDDLIRLSKEKVKKFGDIIGASYSDFFDRRLINDPSFKGIFDFVPNSEQNYKKLNIERILGFFHDDFEMKCMKKQSQKKGVDILIDKFVIHNYRIEGSEGGAYIGLSKALDRQTIEKIKASYLSIFDDGSFEKIYFKWCGEKLPSRLIKTQEK